MTLRSVVNRCANSTVRIDHLFALDKGYRGLVSFTFQSAPGRVRQPALRLEAQSELPSTRIESMITGSSGTPMLESLTGT